MSTSTTPVMAPINTHEQTETKNDADNTANAEKIIVRDITQEKWFWEIAVPS